MDEDDCRTAPATPGLLIMITRCWTLFCILWSKILRNWSDTVLGGCRVGLGNVAISEKIRAYFFSFEGEYSPASYAKNSSYIDVHATALFFLAEQTCIKMYLSTLVWIDQSWVEFSWVRAPAAWLGAIRGAAAGVLPVTWICTSVKVTPAPLFKLSDRWHIH